MRYPPCTLRNLLLSSAFLACIALAACGDWCFSGVINNPNGVIITTKNGSPPPTCPPSTIMTTMHVAIIKSQLCESCTPSADTPEWIDLAPQLRLQPRQIDLIADSTPLILVQNALVPVGTYREIRLQFAPNTSVSSGDTLPAKISCGENRENCMLMANGNIEQLYFAGEPPELVVPLQINGSNALAVVPGATLDLRLTLQPHQLSSVSASQGWQVRFTLAGRASIFR